MNTDKVKTSNFKRQNEKSKHRGYTTLNQKVFLSLLFICSLFAKSLQGEGIDQLVDRQIFVEFKDGASRKGVALDVNADQFLFDPNRESPLFDPEPRWISLVDVVRISFPDGTLVYGMPENFLKDQERKTYPNYVPAVAVVSGVAIGAVLGGLIGLVAPKDYSSQMYENAMNGALIGMTLMPFVNYEIITKKMGKAGEKNKWTMCLSVNNTTSNHSETIPETGYAIGINRSYFVKDHFDLVAGISYNLRSFDLRDQKVYFPWSGFNPEIRRQNITFTVGYVDVQLVPQVNYRKADLFLGAGIGVAASARVYEKTRRTTLSIEDLDDWTWPPPEYDFYHVSDEPESSMPYFALVATTEIEWKKIIIRFSFKKAFKESRQMSPLADETQLKSIEFSLGYLF